MYYAPHRPSRNPCAMSGLGQIIPGIRPETQRMVLYGSLALIGFSVAIWFATRQKAAPVVPAGARK